MKINVLDLFAGSRSFSGTADDLGHNTFSSDILPLPKIDYVVDIFEFDVNKVPFVPDLIWASPDCAAWSKAAGKVHFEGKGISKPKTEKAEKSFSMVLKTLEIIEHFLKLNPDLKFYIENPVGKMQYVDALRPNELFAHHTIKRVVTIDQCQYGREFQKSTHIFTNDLEWIPKQRCPGRANGCKHLQNIKDVGDKYDRVAKKAARLPGTNKGRRTLSSLGLLGEVGYFQRAKIPKELCTELINNCVEYKTSNEVFEKCDKCPFQPNRILDFSSDIYEKIKEKNRGKLHRCHTGKNNICLGFLKEATERWQLNTENFPNELTIIQ
jgi:hypothetical protein